MKERTGPSCSISSCSFLCSAYSTCTVVLIAIGCSVRDNVQAICNPAAWCHALLYSCLVLYINLHLGPILYFPSCHIAHTREASRKRVQNRTFGRRTAETDYYILGGAVFFKKKSKETEDMDCPAGLNSNLFFLNMSKLLLLGAHISASKQNRTWKLGKSRSVLL